MTAITPLEFIHKKGLFGDHHKKNEKDLLKISEVKNLSIIQIVQYKKSKVNINDVKIESLEIPTQSSSVKSNKELPLMMQIGKKTKAYKFLNINWIHDFESLALFVFGPIVRNRIQLYRKYLSVRDENYLIWSIDQIVNWNQKTPLNDVIHIHGTIDLVFPSIYIKKAIFVSGGNHAMILRKASWFNKNLPRIISEN